MTTHTEQQLRRLPKPRLAQMHCEHGGVLTVAEYIRWRKAELVAAVLEDEQGHAGAEGHGGEAAPVSLTEYRAEVTAGGDVWSSNGLRYDNAEDALLFAKDLARRWTLVTRWRAVPDTVPLNQAYVLGSEDGAW